MADELDPNHALLVGEIAGLLSTQLDVDLDTDADGNYTGTIVVLRPSGLWRLTVELAEPENG